MHVVDKTRPVYLIFEIQCTVVGNLSHNVTHCIIINNVDASASLFLIQCLYLHSGYSL